MSRKIVFLLVILFTGISRADTTVNEIVEAADTILNSVQELTGVEKVSKYSRKDQLLLTHNHLSRNDWSYWPRERAGLSLRLMTNEQRTSVHKLLLAVLSYPGYQKIGNIMQLENILGPMENSGLPRGIGTYELAFFGKPSSSQPWALRFEGHHISLNISIEADGISVTPTFLGSDPSIVVDGQLAGFRALPLEEDYGFKLINSLTDNQRKQAIISGEPPFDIMSGTLLKDRHEWDDWKDSLEPDGIAIVDLSRELKEIAKQIIEEVIGTYRSEISKKYIESIIVDDLYFAWIGSTKRGDPHYYRIQGKDFIFEYDNVQDEANHIHTIWRSRAGDFGGSLLKEHYTKAH